MPDFIGNLVQSFHLLWNRKTRWPLILAPIIFGIILYSSFFYLGYDFIGQKLTPFLASTFHVDQMNFLIKWTLMAFLTILGFFLMNWTFVLAVSLIAAPFNDFLSESISDELEGKPFVRERSFWNSILPFIWNETKKISVIIFFSFIALTLSFIPVLLPITLWINFLLISSQFVDYSWVRNGLTARQCLQDLIKNLFTYTFAGGVFFFLITIPVINLLVPAWATSHFTLLYTRKKIKL